jgi:hypothetical protein
MKWDDLTKEQQDHFDRLVEVHGKPPVGATHFDMRDFSSSSFMVCKKGKWCFWDMYTVRFEEWVDDGQSVKIPIPDKPWHEEDMSENKHSHYYREWHGKLDIYRVIDLWNITDPCFQHALKKIMCAGNRGHKDLKKDVQDIIDTMQRKLEMMEETE